MFRRALVVTLLISRMTALQAEEAIVPAVVISVTNGEKLAFGSERVSEVATQDAQNGRGIFLQMDDVAGRALSRLTGSNVGRRLTVSVCGEPLLTAKISARIDSGRLLLSGLSDADAVRINAVLNGERSC